jgi:hypothetical protein
MLHIFFTLSQVKLLLPASHISIKRKMTGKVFTSQENLSRNMDAIPLIPAKSNGLGLLEVALIDTHNRLESVGDSLTAMSVGFFSPGAVRTEDAGFVEGLKAQIEYPKSF